MDVYDYSNASSNIKLFLLRNNWTADDLASRTNMTAFTLKKRLRRNAGWTLREGIDISKVLGTNINELFFGKMTMKYEIITNKK